MEDRSTGLRNSLASLLTMGLIAGIVAAGINIAYMYLYESMSGFSYREEVNFMSVAISSIIPGIFAGMGFFMLFRFTTDNTVNIFILIMSLIAILSIIYPVVATPEGVADFKKSNFLWLTIPMHIIAAVIYVVMLVRSVSVKA